MTRVRAVTTWLDGRVALYATLGTLTTADRTCELVGRDLVALVRVLLEARGAYVARKVVTDALGWSSPRVASKAVERLCWLLHRADMPLAVHRVQGLGYALTWVGERPGVDLRPAPAKILAPKPDAPTPLQRALAAPPPPKRTDRDEILRLRRMGWSVTPIAKRIGWSESAVATVLGVQWGRERA